MAADVPPWLKSTPKSTQDHRLIAEVLAEAWLNRSEWSTLSAQLERADWQEREFVRLTLLTRAAREQHNQPGAQSYWLKALKAAAGNRDRLIQLGRLTESWGWRDETDEVLGALVTQFPEQKWAENYLTTSLHQAGKTQALQNLLARALEREPTNNVLKSNLATLGLLLDATDKRSHKLAEEAFQAQPTDPFIASTY